MREDIKEVAVVVVVVAVVVTGEIPAGITVKVTIRIRVKVTARIKAMVRTIKIRDRITVNKITISNSHSIPAREILTVEAVEAKEAHLIIRTGETAVGKEEEEEGFKVDGIREAVTPIIISAAVTTVAEIDNTEADR